MGSEKKTTIETEEDGVRFPVYYRNDITRNYMGNVEGEEHEALSALSPKNQTILSLKHPEFQHASCYFLLRSFLYTLLYCLLKC